MVTNTNTTNNQEASTPPPLGQIDSLPEALGKLLEALQKTYGLLKLRGSGREGQGDGEGRGARGTSVSVVVGVNFQRLSRRQSVGNALGAKYFNSAITLQ